MFLGYIHFRRRHRDLDLRRLMGHQARERHIERLKKYANPVYPPTYEEVEI